MATTPTYSWPIPDNTDLVKDGAEAIRDLGNAIDTTVDGLPGAGLVHIETQTFSAVSAVSFNDVFSSTFVKYLIIGEVSQAAADSASFRFRVAGTDASGSNYVRVNYLLTTASITAQSGTTTNISLNTDVIQKNLICLKILNPFSAQTTNMFYETGSSSYQRNGSVIHNLANSYDGFSLIAGSSTISGNVSVYGFKE